mgnify:CR=1 FL=1
MAVACADWAVAFSERVVGAVDAAVATAGCQGRVALEATAV